MQRYRVNYRLLAILALATAFSSAVAFGAWRFQINRNADKLLVRVETAENEGRLVDARDSLEQYTKLRQDDIDQQVRLAKLAKRIADEQGASREDQSKSYFILTQTVRTSNDPEVRRLLIDTYMDWGRTLDALSNVEELLDEKPDDPELLSLQAECLFRSKDFEGFQELAYELIGYVPSNDEFVDEQARAPHEVRVYSMLASHLRTEEDKEELADRVVERMVEVNKDAAEAHLEFYKVQNREALIAEARAKSEHEAAVREAEKISDEAERAEKIAELEKEAEEDAAVAEAAKQEARESLERAYSIAPDNTDVLVHKGLAARTKEDFETALKYFRRAKEFDPDSWEYHYHEAVTLIQADDREGALEVLDDGLTKFELARVVQLSNLKVDLLLEERNYKPIFDVIDDLKKIRSQPALAMADFHAARILYAKREWRKAAAALFEVRPRLYAFDELQSLAGVMQASCHLAMGQRDLAEQCYRQVLVQSPNYARARQGLNQLIEQWKPEEPMPTDQINELVLRNLELPESERNWQEVDDYIDKIIEERGLPPARRLLLEAQVAFLKEDHRGAEQKIRAAFEMDPEDLTTRLAAVRLLQFWPGKGPPIALKLLDQVIEKFGDNASMRIMRADLLTAANDPDLQQQLLSIADGIEDWPDAQQAGVWRSIGARLHQRGFYEAAWEAIENSIELAPSELPTRSFLFDIALAKKDEALMLEAQARLLEMIDDKTDPDYVVTEVKRQVSRFGDGKADRDDLREVQEKLAAAIERRSSWHELYILDAQLAMLIDGDMESALRSLELALDAGPAVTNAVALQTKLLFQSRRYQEAYEKMRLLPMAKRTELLGRLEAEIYQKLGMKNEAFKSAKKVAEIYPQDDATQMWFAGIARYAEESDAAVQAMKQGLELRSNAPNYWFELVAHYFTQGDAENVFDTMRQATLAVNAEFIPLMAARTAEMGGRWQAAEDLYLQAYSSQLDDIGVLRILADFYVRHAAEAPENAGKAARYLNRIMRMANDQEVEQTHPAVMWARTEAAKMLASRGDYRSSVKAEKMLSHAMAVAKEKEAIAGQLADVLAARGDPESRLRAAKLFLDLKEEKGLTQAGDLRLAQLLFEVGQWNECKRHMNDVVSRYPQVIGVRTYYISMLLDQREFRLAKRQLTELKNLENAQSVYAEFQARLAAAEGNMTEVRQILTSVTPDLRRLDKDNLKTLLGLAALAERVGDYEYAEQLLRLYVKHRPDESIQLTRFVSLYGDPNHAVELIEKEFDNDPIGVSQMAVTMLRRRRQAIGNEVDDAVEKIVLSCYRKDPFDATRMVLRAEMFEVVQRVDQAIEAYEELLERDDLSTRIRAAGNNNLAFLYALTGTKVERALELVNETVELIGPLSDVLDTRAVVYLALGKGQEAVTDMEMAIRIGATPSKYFHLAQAHLMAGNPQQALAAWEEGVAIGLDATALTSLEQDVFLKAKSQIETLQNSRAQR